MNLRKDHSHRTSPLPNLPTLPSWRLRLSPWLLLVHIELLHGNLATSRDGCLSSIDIEERSEVRYALRIAEFRESTDI